MVPNYARAAAKRGLSSELADLLPQRPRSNLCAPAAFRECSLKCLVNFNQIDILSISDISNQNSVRIVSLCYPLWLGSSVFVAASPELLIGSYSKPSLEFDG